MGKFILLERENFAFPLHKKTRKSFVLDMTYSQSQPNNNSNFHRSFEVKLIVFAFAKID